jgi:hypothetical protein
MPDVNAAKISDLRKVVGEAVKQVDAGQSKPLTDELLQEIVEELARRTTLRRD